MNLAKEIFDKGKAVFVDARPLEDYNDGHIQGAISLPDNQFDMRIESFKQKYSPSQHIVTYCSGRTCNDSHKLTERLFENGFHNVSVFIDGFPGWEAQGCQARS